MYNVVQKKKYILFFVFFIVVIILPLTILNLKNRQVAKNYAATTQPTIITPLKVSNINSHYFMDGTGKGVALSGSHTWNDFQDLSQSSTPPAFDFTTYVNFLKSHGQNVTILWRKDLPTYCGWGAGGTWNVAQFPWLRNGNGNATDGKPKFDLSQFDQTYFDRLRARVVLLQQNNIYAIVQLFDGLQLLNNRCSTDGYPFTGANNINGVDDGGGTGSMTMTSPNAITAFQDAYVKKVIDTVGDQPNVLWEISEEAPNNSTWWEDHMISLIHTYEATKTFQHPVGYPWLTGGSDQTIFSSNADWVAPSAKFSPTNNQGKVVINDSDHSYYGMWNDSAQTNRNYIWENFTNGSSVIFMDPYEINWSSGNRNLCANPVNGVCNDVDHRWDNMRDNLGYTVSYANKMNILAMNPQGNLSSTGYVLANSAVSGSEFLVYSPNGGSFTVNLSSTTHTLSVEWLNPATGVITQASSIIGGSNSQSFTPPFSGDAVLYLKDTGSLSPTPPNTQIPTATLTPTPTTAPTPTPTVKPSNTPIPTASPVPNSAKLSLTLGLDGIGKAGDNVSRGTTGNTNPLHPTRTVTLTLSDQNNNPLPAFTGIISYDSTSGLYKVVISVPYSVPTGVYLLKLETPTFLQKTVVGILTLIQGETTTVPTTYLTAGDINNDNQISLLDYNLLLGCFGSSTSSCMPSDLDDNGTVDGIDYNLFLREMSVQIGG